MLSEVLLYHYVNYLRFYFQVQPLFFNDLGKLFYFAEPGSVFFTNIIFFHDEVCFFLILILVFTYWMLYVILFDHIYYSEDSLFNIYHDRDNILCIFYDFVINYSYYYYYIILFLSKKLIDITSKPFNFSKEHHLFYLHSNILYILGLESSSSFKTIDDFSFFDDTNSNNLLLNNYDIHKKFLFSGTNSNIISIQGKLLELEELSLLSNLSIDYNHMLLNNIISYYKYYALLNLTRYFGYIPYFGVDIAAKLTPVKDIDAMLEFLIEEKTIPFFDEYTTNVIFNININMQESFFYKRRYLQFSYLFNPYLEVFNDLFSLNDNNNNIYTFKEPGLYKWWEFKYLYIITRARFDFLNLSNLSRGVNRDIIIDSWEYHHSISFEYIWALFPTLVILSIIGPSFILLFSSFSFNDAYLTVKVIGHQWYWSYELATTHTSESGDFSIIFDSRILEINPIERSLNPFELDYSYLRLLDVDKPLILIAHKPINFLITSGDVLHSFAIPAFGIKVDAVPGRINTFYLEGSKVGVYYGQCSELCGFGHGFMPIAVEVVKHKDIIIK